MSQRQEDRQAQLTTAQEMVFAKQNSTRCANVEQSRSATAEERKVIQMKIKIAILIILFYTHSCQNDQDELRITGISAVSLDSDTVLSVPDSLSVTFHHNNNELQVIGRYFG